MFRRKGSLRRQQEEAESSRTSAGDVSDMTHSANTSTATAASSSHKGRRSFFRLRGGRRGKSKTRNKVEIRTENNERDSRTLDDDRNRAGSSEDEDREAMPEDTEDAETKKQFTGPEGKKQKAIMYSYFGDDVDDNMELVRSDVPELKKDDEVLVRVLASTVSSYDCNIRRGIDFEIFNPVSLPNIPGQDVVGTVVQVGDKVIDFEVGEKVAALVRTGGNARYIVVPHSSLVKVPKGCDPAEAVCMVSTFMTAYQSIRMVTKDEFSLEDKTVLITGADEPIGQALIQLCKRANAERIYVTSPNFKHKQVSATFNVEVLSNNPEEWREDLKDQIDVAFDATCEDGHSSPASSLKRDGVLICLGMSSYLRNDQQGMFGASLSAHWTNFKSRNLMSKTKSYNVWESFKQDPEAFKVSEHLSAQRIWRWRPMAV
uniref:Enoyl reductase (ER) domain-containing protein n=1 Tax=Craspedostauros australis TaxID=1486917 RepID=A0A7R9X144_9STRA|mmetsp:Transcript_5354/g.14485  ORF Transcript_5354/g.14485 Transcript_5354/m.14485 type:complete len:430 (+) Transcript_5354:92-1381(+)